MTNSIKSFIYLDDYKMYSISSQIFEGMTEYIIKSTNDKTTEKTNQKGPILSGQLLADIIEKGKNETEKKFLHDYSYTLFENKLLEDQKVLVLNNDNLSESIRKIDEYNFIKITSRIAFNDTNLIEKTTEKFNELGIAITYVQEHNKFSEIKELAKTADKIKDRNNQSKAKSLVASARHNVIDRAKEKNLYLDPEFLKSLEFLFNFGYHSQFEVQMPFTINNEHSLFSAILQRDKLRESEINIIKKYARLSEKEFTIFGILTQSKTKNEIKPLYEDRNGENLQTMKEVLMNIIFHITNVEAAFSGKLDYEYVIDPIAIYREF